MSTRRSSIGIIFLTVLIDLIGFGIVIPVLPLYAERFGATPLQIGLLVGVYSFCSFLFAPVMGRLSDRFGRRPVLIVSVIGTAAGFYLMGAAPTLAVKFGIGALWLLFTARIIDGISGGNISTAQAYIADITAPEDRAKAMGIIGAAFGLGFMIGPAIGGVMSQISLGAPFYFAGVLATLNAIFITLRLPESLAPEHRSNQHPRQSMADVFRHANGPAFTTAVVTYFFSIAGFAIMTTLYALFNQQRFGLDAKQTGYIFALIGFIAVVIQGGLLRKLLKYFSEARLAVVGAALMTIALIALPLVNSISALLWVSALIAVGNSFTTPTLQGLASRFVDQRWQGRAAGIMQSAGSLGRTIGPALAGWLLHFDLEKPVSHYARTPMWTGAALLALTFFLMLSLLKVTPPASAPAAPAAA
jgi:DHA1 family tetracycline resistance protein-like MFS transporter